MVWGVMKLTYNCFNDIKGDVIFQHTGVMFNIHRANYSDFDLYCFWCSGVNIFHVDRTKHDETFFKQVATKVLGAQEYSKTMYYKPIGLAVTISIRNPVEIDETVDIVILNDVTTEEEITEFRKKYLNSRRLPTLVWISSYSNENLNSIIKTSDGIAMLRDDKICADFCSCVFKTATQANKPVYLYRADLLFDYPNRESLLPAVSQIVNLPIDGIMLEDNNDPDTVKSRIYNIACAFRFIEVHFEKGDKATQRRKELKLPVITSLSIAFAASLAAFNSGAQIIIVLTRSGSSARWLSSTCPPCHVVAITTLPTTARMMHLYKKVVPLLYHEPRVPNWQEEKRNRVRFGTIFALKIGLVGNGAKLVVLAPSADDSGFCDSVQITTVPFRCQEAKAQ